MVPGVTLYQKGPGVTFTVGNLPHPRARSAKAVLNCNFLAPGQCVSEKFFWWKKFSKIFFIIKRAQRQNQCESQVFFCYSRAKRRSSAKLQFFCPKRAKLTTCCQFTRTRLTMYCQKPGPAPIISRPAGACQVFFAFCHQIFFQIF